MPRQISITEDTADVLVNRGITGGVAYRHDKYWRLASYTESTKAALRSRLEAVNYHVPLSPLHRGTLAQQLQRLDRQLLSYFSCSVTELQQYVTARGLQLEQSRRSLVNKLITALETADANPSFKYLLDLPPELRVLIYGFYMSNFDSTLQSPTQPPLTKVSTQIRQESLPIFYNTCTFGLALVAQQKLPPPGIGSGWHLVWHPDTDTYLKSLLPESLAMMRSFHIQIVTSIGRGHVSNQNSRSVFKVRIGNRKNSCVVELIERPHLFNTIHPWVFARWNDHLATLEGEIQAVFEIARRRVDPQSGEQIPKLVIEDLWVARRTMEARPA
ncbi:hypothetical protein CKM354_001015300 [Cercospora kikuchii]|uniref:Uncharacterized protein n=1 Tax=Cercospora kikuchii TaxID=84275 RepID=A0A9P3CPN9_9PEZI|nr:uncharacterized protein CKM354_001015300 [Cercospora kikuchii]GIZ47052.1 hypothetical protein CKM354_001015300 [Cercospora kikuchii]